MNGSISTMVALPSVAYQAEQSPRDFNLPGITREFKLPRSNRGLKLPTNDHRSSIIDHRSCFTLAPNPPPHVVSAPILSSFIACVDFLQAWFQTPGWSDSRTQASSPATVDSPLTPASRAFTRYVYTMWYDMYVCGFSGTV